MMHMRMFVFHKHFKWLVKIKPTPKSLNLRYATNLPCRYGVYTSFKVKIEKSKLR
jgi:hypothetical protein